MIAPQITPPRPWVGIRNISDYSPFGVLLKERTVESEFFRRSFNGMEVDPEVKDEGNSYDFGARMLDARVGRWFKTDLMESEAHSWSPYRYAYDNPIRFTDVDGNFEIDEATAAAYPKFASMLKNLATIYSSKPEDFRKAFKEYSQLSDSEISKMLEYKIVKNGTPVKQNQATPRIVVQNITGANGETPMEFSVKSDGNGNPTEITGVKNTGEIKINKSMVETYENLPVGSYNSQIRGAEVALESTVLHEGTHYGDALDGSLDKTGIKIVAGKIVLDHLHGGTQTEGGKAFEKKAYGQDIDPSNAEQYAKDKLLTPQEKSADYIKSPEYMLDKNPPAKIENTRPHNFIPPREIKLNKN